MDLRTAIREKFLHANIGAVSIFCDGLPPEKRLPLRAYHAAMIFKNAVPVAYFKVSLFLNEWKAASIFTTPFGRRNGVLYAQTLHIFHHLLGVSVFTLDPYQIGYENEEGIESGAFLVLSQARISSGRPEVMNLF